MTSRTKPILILALLALAVRLANGQAYDAMRRSTNITGSDLMAVQTNSAGAVGQKFLTAITASNFLESLKLFPGWPSGLGTLTTVKTNGANVSTTAASVSFIEGTNVVLRATNTAGAVTVQINAAGGSGVGDVSTAQLNTASNAAISTVNATLKPYATNIGWLPSIYTNVLYVNATNNGSASLFAAKTAAIAAGIPTIVVGPGTYTNAVTNLSWNGTWLFLGRPRLSLVDIPTNTTGAGIFDDRFSGAVTCNVLGSLDIDYFAGTNAYVDPDCIVGYNTNALGPVVITNAGTRMNWQADTMVRGASIGAGIFGLTVLNCATGTVFKTFSFAPLFPGVTEVNITTNCVGDPGGQITAPLIAMSAHNWALGTYDLEVNTSVTPGGYFISGYGATATDDDELRVRANYVDGKIYLVGSGPGWKVWADILELKRSGADNPSAIDCYYSGSHYFRLQKLSSGNEALGARSVINTAHPGASTTGNSNLNVWLNIDKVAGSNRLISVAHGAVQGYVGHLQKDGPHVVDGTILVTNASSSLILSGNLLETAGTALISGGGRTELNGFTITSTNNDPVFAFPAGDLSLNAVKLNTANGTNAIRAPSAETVKLNAVQRNKPLHANVTADTSNASQFGRVNIAGVTAGSLLSANSSGDLTNTAIGAHLGFDGATLAVTDTEALEWGGISTNKFLTTNHAQLQFASSNNVQVAAGTAIGVTGSGSAGVQTWTVAVTDADLVEWSGISTNKFLTTNHAQLQFASSNNVRVAAGTGGITVVGSGSGGVQTWTISDDDAGGGGGSTNPVTFAAGSFYNSNSFQFQGSGMFLRMTNMWFDGGVSSLYSNVFAANAGGLTNLLATNILDGQTVSIWLFPSNGVTVGFPQFVAGDYTDGAVVTPATNGWTLVQVTRRNTYTNIAVYTPGLNLAAGNLMRLDTNYATRTVSASLGNDVLTNLAANAASTVTNENSTALQINTGTLTLTPGVLSNIVASGHGAPYIAANTNSGTLNNATNFAFRSGLTVSNDTAGIVSFHINPVLGNIIGVGANNVTNENSTALQINTGTLTLTPGNVSNLVNNTTIDFQPGNQITNVIAIKEQVWTNYVQTSSNFVFSFNTNYVELKNQTNVVFTNIVEEATAVHGKIVVHIHNTTGVTMGLVWPAYGAQHGYFFGTNINNPILTTTSLTTGKHGVASVECFGTNLFATWTEWP